MEAPHRLLASLVATLLLFAACTSVANPELDERAILGVLVPWGDLDAERQLAQEVHDREQQLVADCMKGLGMRFTPVGYEAVAFGPGIGVDRTEFITRYGFGISTNDETFAAFERHTRDAEDPNQEHQRSLSQQHRTLYSETLSVCDRRVREALPRLPKPFQQAVDGLKNRVTADIRVITAEQEWEACVRGTASSVLPDFSTLDDVLAWLLHEYQLVKERPAQLAALQDLEREIATAHLECEPPVLAAMREVAAEYEPSFVHDHADVFQEQLEFLVAG